MRYAEHDGAELHGEDQVEADSARRSWLADTDSWCFGIFVAADVAGNGKLASDRLMADVVEARRAHSARRRVAR